MARSPSPTPLSSSPPTAVSLPPYINPVHSPTPFASTTLGVYSFLPTSPANVQNPHAQQMMCLLYQQGMMVAPLPSRTLKKEQRKKEKAEEEAKIIASSPSVTVETTEPQPKKIKIEEAKEDKMSDDTEKMSNDPEKISNDAEKISNDTEKMIVEPTTQTTKKETLEQEQRKRKLERYRRKRENRNFHRTPDTRKTLLANARQRDNTGHFVPEKKPMRFSSILNNYM